MLVEHVYQDFLLVAWSIPGYFGVRLFFVLSGFLITEILLKSRDELERGQAGFWRVIGIFYIRRSLRIFPIYYLTLLLVIAISPWINGLQGNHVWRLLYLTNFHMAIHNTGDVYYGHLWTLAVEEQFYIFWPFVVLLLPRRAVLPMIGVLVLLAPTARLLAAYSDLNDFWIRKPPWTCFDSLGFGALLACMRHAPQSTELPKSSVALAALLAALIGVLIIALDARHRCGEGALFTSIFLGLAEAPLLMVLVHFSAGHRNNSFKRILDNSRLQWIGRRSYGFYLYHAFIMPFISLGFRRAHLSQDSFLECTLYFLAVFGVTLALSEVSWRLIEQPLNKLKDGFSTVDNGRG